MRACVRSLLTQEGICLMLQPDFHFLEVAYPYVARRLLTDEDPALRERLFQARRLAHAHSAHNFASPRHAAAVWSQRMPFCQCLPCARGGAAISLAGTRSECAHAAAARQRDLAARASAVEARLAP